MPIDTGQEVPDEMNIFYKAFDAFIPPGKQWKDLSPEERELVKNQYRFSPFKPGTYQAITGINNLS